MSMPDSVSNVLDREFLGIRCRLIELAASFDRIDRAGGPPADDSRLADIRLSLEVLAGNAPDRAEQVQLVFSKRGQRLGTRG